ncbi:MAG: hypothetical protein L6Q76_21085, partial [Polyangiaceae bacterium]|nr:hypothetical protein [Polyangiaceae bacterium]
MRNLLISLFVSCLTAIGALGCGSDTDGSGSGQAGSGGSGSGGAGGAGGGADACAGKACGDPCTTCPEGAPCMPQACNAEGVCVEEALATCSPCPTAQPTDGD